MARGINISLALLVSLNALAVILGTVQSIEEKWGWAFSRFETFSVAIFVVE